jgi:hypothetical protein
VAGLLSRPLERRWLRPVLDANADRPDVELRPVIDSAAAAREAAFTHYAVESANLWAVIRCLLILRAEAA